MFSHRLSTLRRADLILVADRGTIVASGPHATLLHTCLLYRELWSAQQVDPAMPVEKRSYGAVCVRNPAAVTELSLTPFHLLESQVPGLECCLLLFATEWTVSSVCGEVVMTITTE